MCNFICSFISALTDNLAWTKYSWQDSNGTLETGIEGISNENATMENTTGTNDTVMEVDIQFSNASLANDALGTASCSETLPSEMSEWGVDLGGLYHIERIDIIPPNDPSE